MIDFTTDPRALTAKLQARRAREEASAKPRTGLVYPERTPDPMGELVEKVSARMDDERAARIGKRFPGTAFPTARTSRAVMDSAPARGCYSRRSGKSETLSSPVGRVSRSRLPLHRQRLRQFGRPACWLTAASLMPGTARRRNNARQQTSHTTQEEF